MLEVERLTAGYLGGRHRVTVVKDVTIRVDGGEIVGLVGESGCGKTTLARVITGLDRPSAGVVRFAGVDVHTLRGRALRDHRRHVQMVFQDPYLTLSPRQRVRQALAEPLRIHRIGDSRARSARVDELLDLVGLDPGVGERRPRQLSGGQRQRVAIARALALGPRLLVCDEPVTALDVSVQAKVLNLLCDLRDRLGLGCLFITHDLAVVRQLADRVAVMRDGRIVEQGPTLEVTTTPRHPYTRALLAATPTIDAGSEGRPPG
ncbi:dipeptide/oligopeptide/nickel ABC transporter ATP-binding protein [Sphaerisporangium krabiense]|uniref:ABC-type glutathione transport system ATPase component n=1 Tax=Sphaerisporangium krabiense TaxID=763782 RepID=A0A7W9DPZ1_9ACTN|nr:ATP-binding cassette domain-containing protein [Sphaerisporangium krabiense]MBB5625855.1 ABC-type glutathione transport system ATPase component [Sphaerisporangium krabiense]GII64659.1 dipeptide/oligopeptide/nickel ABC transporter ATP-binding protein [Sphaerisporangium krabiense]